VEGEIDRLGSEHMHISRFTGLRLLGTVKVIRKNPEDIESIIKFFRNADEKTSENLSNFAENKTVLTISRSHIVERGLKRAKKVFISPLLARPHAKAWGYEGEEGG
jgi:hypothetical protein